MIIGYVIPSPNVTDNHQYKNAKVLSDAGAAILVEECQLSKLSLADEVKNLVEDPERRGAMEQKIAEFSRADVGKLIYKEITEIIAGANAIE